LAVAVLGVVGDLSESLLKRALKVKDMGGILPGHGGVLDRIDAILFVVPAAYVIYLLAGYL
jgi:phosphatidate cytidylyltransferase